VLIVIVEARVSNTIKVHGNDMILEPLLVVR
jgi:hypothetical protein